MIQLFFGNKQHFFDTKKQSNFLSKEFFKDKQLAFLQENFSLTHLVLLKQVHGNDGLVIKKKEALESFTLRTFEGDFLITNQKDVGLGLLTADCLPIIFYDAQKKVIAAAHAGWRGSVLHIVKKVIHHMKLHFNSGIEDVKIFFGPAAKACCYEVSQEFYNNAQDDTLFGQSIIKKKDKIYFDNSYYNTKQLLACGILQKNISYQDYFCTMCTGSFCSYRQDRKAKGQNITVVSLK